MSEDLRRKEFRAAVRPDADRRVTFTLSTPLADRQGDTIDAAGWHLDAYRQNPAVLYGHDHKGLPVARAVDVGIVGGALVATAEFVPPDLYPFGDQVYRMLKAGYLSAVSVGFRPLRSEPIPGGTAFLEQELLEFSVVPVPANPEALVIARSLPVDAGAVQKWLAGRRGDEVVLELHESSRRREAVDVDPEDLAAAVRLAVPRVREELRSGLATAVANELARRRGRVD